MALSFDSTYYYNQRPDVLAAWVASDRSMTPHEFAMNHYNNHGWKEGANPNEVFNTNEYLAANTDVADSGRNPFTHYNRYGQDEGRSPNATFPALADFNWEVYLSSNPDLGAAGITTAAAAYNHFLNFGHAEGRPGTPAALSFTLAEAMAASELPEGYTISDGTLTGAQTLADIAAAQAILAGADNPSVPELGGDFTVEDSAENILAADELPVDISLISFTDDTITAEQRDALIELGFDADELPGLSDDDALTEALENLANAQGDLADFVEAANENDDLTVAPPGDRAQVEIAIGTEYNAAVADLAASTGLPTFGTRSEALQNEAIADTRATLTEEISDLNTDIAGVSGLGAAVRLYNSAFAADAAAAIALTAAGTKSLADLAAFNTLTGVTYAGDDAGAGGIADIDNVTQITDGGVPAEIVITKNAAGTFVLASGVTETSHNGVTALLNSLNANQGAFNTAERAFDALNDPITGATVNLALFNTAVANDDELGTDRGFTTGLEVANELSTFQGDLNTFNDEVARFTAAAELANELENLDDSITEAIEAIEGLGYEPQFVDAATIVYIATADADVFVYTGEDGIDGTINGFEADDILFLSTDFDYSTLADTDNMQAATINFGDVAALDVFVQQDGANAVVYVEANTYDGQNGPWGGNTITLVGVDASSLVFENGMLRIADAVA